jgi:predicted dehydrogenase
MVEKPVSLRRDEAQLLLEVQQASGLVLTSNLILRASPRFREVRRMAAAGELGDIYYMEGDYLHAILWKLTQGWRGRIPEYSVVHGGGIHLVDLMRWIADREVEAVSGMGARNLLEGAAFQGYDTTVALMRFAGGALAKCTTSLGPARPKFHALNVYGTKATFVNEMPSAKLYIGDRPEDERTVDVPYPAIEKGDLLPDFIAAVSEGREPDVSAVDVFRVMDVCFATVDAINSGRTIDVRYSI